MRKRRLDLGLFQQEVAEIMGVTDSTITNWELNRTKPEVQYHPRIINFLGYSPYEPTEDFSHWLKQRREALGLTQKEFARLLGMDPGNLTHWEMKKHRPTRRSKQRVIEFFTA